MAENLLQGLQSAANSTSQAEVSILTLHAKSLVAIFQKAVKITFFNTKISFGAINVRILYELRLF